MLIIASNVQVSDTTGDAILYKAGYKKIDLLITLETESGVSWTFISSDFLQAEQ